KARLTTPTTNQSRARNKAEISSIALPSFSPEPTRKCPSGKGVVNLAHQAQRGADGEEIARPQDAVRRPRGHQRPAFDRAALALLFPRLHHLAVHGVELGW